MKLKVIAGAKEGTEIALKRSKFVIGRASDCTLRAGSDAISRHHCVLLRGEDGYSVRDLGSRNGTYVNDVKIDGETLLRNGDELRVGPLHFTFEGAHDLDRSKKPAVKSVAEAVQRTAAADDSKLGDDDISAWLLGPPEGESKSMRETQTFRFDETRAVPKVKPEGDGVTDEEPATAEEGASHVLSEGESADGETAEMDSSKDGKKAKKIFGKLPHIPKKQQSKDSREAAADILREMARRR